MGFPFNAVTSKQRGIQIYAGVKGGLGTPTLSGLNAFQMTIADGGVGNYTVSFPAGGNINITAVATPSTDNTTVKIGTITISSVQFIVEDLSGAAAEGNFHFMIMNTSASDLQG